LIDLRLAGIRQQQRGNHGDQRSQGHDKMHCGRRRPWATAVRADKGAETDSDLFSQTRFSLHCVPVRPWCHRQIERKGVKDAREWSKLAQSKSRLLVSVYQKLPTDRKGAFAASDGCNMRGSPSWQQAEVLIGLFRAAPMTQNGQKRKFIWTMLIKL